jgi:hypothetical protein
LGVFGSTIVYLNVILFLTASDCGFLAGDPFLHGEPRKTANPTHRRPCRIRVEEKFMRTFLLLAATLSVIALAACAGSGGDSDQSRRGQAGPYVSGAGGLGF